MRTVAQSTCLIDVDKTENRALYLQHVKWLADRETLSVK